MTEPKQREKKQNPWCTISEQKTGHCGVGAYFYRTPGFPGSVFLGSGCS